MRPLWLPALVVAGCFDFESLRQRTPDLSAAEDMGVTVPACPAPLTGGTHSNTQLFAGSPAQIALSGSNITGSFESDVIDALETRAWKSLAWLTARPYGKPLPDGRVMETGYAFGNADMSANVLLFHFDEAIGAGSFADSSSLNHHGSCTLCPQSGGPGRLRRDVRLMSHSILVPNHSDLEPAQVTLESWVRLMGPPANGEASTLVAKGNQQVPPFTSYAIEVIAPVAPGFPSLQNHARCYIAFTPNNDLGLGAQVQTVASTVTIPPDTFWHHVACTFDGTLVRLYVDGEPQGSNAVPPGSLLAYPMSNRDLSVGSFGGTTNYVNGELDEVALFASALSATAINDHYRRAANRLGLQVRACAEPSCAGAPFYGPDATSSTFFHEACAAHFGGTPSLALNNLDCDGNGNPDDSPRSAVPPSRYLQFRAQLDADRSGQTPELRAVSICP